MLSFKGKEVKEIDLRFVVCCHFLYVVEVTIL